MEKEAPGGRGMMELMATGMWLSFSIVARAQGEMAPLPVDPPIGGVGWTVVIPALLFAGSFLGTYLLYKRFAREEDA
jgi:hypothetical protein